MRFYNKNIQKYGTKHSDRGFRQFQDGDLQIQDILGFKDGFRIVLMFKDSCYIVY